MTNEYALTPLETLAIPFLLIALGLLWLSDKIFGADTKGWSGAQQEGAATRVASGVKAVSVSGTAPPLEPPGRYDE